MLAQDWLYGDRARSKYDSFVERHLRLPIKFNPHSSLAVLNTLAERIVFTDDVPSLLYEMHDNKQLTFDGMLSTAKLPYDCFWLEYTSRIGIGDVDEIEYAKYGALIQRIGANAVRMYIITGLKLKLPTETFDKSCSLTQIIEFDDWPPTVRDVNGRMMLRFSVLWAFNEDKLKKDTPHIAELGSVVSEIIFGIFLVTQPKIYSVDTVTWKDSHKRARALKDKPPLLEYRKLKLHIGKTHKHYAQRPAIRSVPSDSTDSVAAIQHRRYHKVMGHFRHYVDHDPPHTTWIEPHYRGDPSLGVTFTERDVSK